VSVKKTASFAYLLTYNKAVTEAQHSWLLNTVYTIRAAFICKIIYVHPFL